MSEAKTIQSFSHTVTLALVADPASFVDQYTKASNHTIDHALKV
jgi:hypothetical protein